MEMAANFVWCFGTPSLPLSAPRRHCPELCLIFQYPLPPSFLPMPPPVMLAVFREDIIMDDTTKYEDDPVPESSGQPPIGV